MFPLKVLHVFGGSRLPLALIHIQVCDGPVTGAIDAQKQTKECKNLG